MIIGISGKALSGKDTVTNIIQWLILKEEKDVEISFENFEEYSKASSWKNVKFADKLKDMVCLLLGCTRKQLEDPKFKESTLGEEWVKYELSYTSHDRLSYCNCPDHHKKYFCSEEEAIKYIEGNLEVDQDSIKISKIELTPRLLLQLLGTECGRNIIHPDIWVNATFAEYKPQHFRTVKYEGSFVEHLTIMPNWIISDVRFPNEAKAIKDRNGILIRVNRNPLGMLNKVNYTYSIQGTLKHVNNELQLVPHESETALDDYNDWDYIIENNGTIEDLIKKVKEILIKEKIIWNTY